MAGYRSLLESGDKVKIEVDGEATGTGLYMRDICTGITRLAKSLAEETSKIPNEQKPSGFTVSFGLKALSDGSVAVTLSPSSANFKVTLNWSADSGAFDTDRIPGMQDASSIS
jgi:hypothetical protein